MNPQMIDLGNGAIVWPSDIEHINETPDGGATVYTKGNVFTPQVLTVSAEAWERIKPIIVMEPRPLVDKLPNALILATSNLYRLLSTLDEDGVPAVINQDVKDTLVAAKQVCFGLIRHYRAIPLKREGGDDASGQ